MQKKRESNIAFIDGQNLHLSTQADGWMVDLEKFRIYLRDKFQVAEAYYFLGFISEEEQELYNTLQKAGFIVVFREHSSALKGKKKGNVDVDIVFEIMKKFVDKKDFDKIVLVSGDGDYIKVVRYMIQQQVLKKIIFPNGKYSSLYKPIKSQYGMNLGTKEIKNKISFVKTKKEVS